MAYLIDTNIIIRFLIGDHKEHLEIATRLFEEVEDGSKEIVILDSVLMETFFVLTKFYKLEKNEVIDDLKTILSLRGVINSDKLVLFETLNIIASKNIDFVDALICSKSKLEGYDKLSFDRDVNHKCNLI